jgi:hypothetical protein
LHAKKTARSYLKMNFDLSELAGQSLTQVRKEGSSWFFSLSGGDALFTEAPWRLVTPHGIAVSSTDDLESFGLPEPLDAGECLAQELLEEPIIRADYDPRTGDLELETAGGRRLQFLQLSGGFESWRLHLRDTEFICLGGGALAEFPRPRPA